MRMILIIVTLAVSVPPPSDWIPVDSVPEEYEYVKKQRCDCGGNYEVTGQSTGKVEDRNFDELRSTCKKCGKERAFFFDVTSLFKEYEVDRSEAAKKKAYDDLNAKYPKISARLLPELQRLLADKNPHARTWAAETIAKIGTPAAIEILLDGYIAAQPPASFLYEGALAKIGPKVLPHMEKRLRAGGDRDPTRWLHRRPAARVLPLRGGAGEDRTEGSSSHGETPPGRRRAGALEPDLPRGRYPASGIKEDGRA